MSLDNKRRRGMTNTKNTKIGGKIRIRYSPTDLKDLLCWICTEQLRPDTYLGLIDAFSQDNITR